jgi:hypothetical protein
MELIVRIGMMLPIAGGSAVMLHRAFDHFQVEGGFADISVLLIAAILGSLGDRDVFRATVLKMNAAKHRLGFDE